MKQEIPLDHCVGKTLEGYALDGSACVLTFNDDTFTTLHARNGWDGCDADMEQGKLDVFDFSSKSLIELGILTADELQQKRDARDADNKKRNDKYERELYERMKAKYGV